jgi:hypothetical protein
MEAQPPLQAPDNMTSDAHAPVDDSDVQLSSIVPETLFLPVEEAVDQMEFDRINYERRVSLNVGRCKQLRGFIFSPP